MSKYRRPKGLRISIAPGGQELCVYIPMKLTYEMLGYIPKAPNGVILQKLTVREKQVFNALNEGLGSKEIANKLNIGVRTVKFHLSSIYKILKMSRKDILIHYGKF